MKSRTRKLPIWLAIGVAAVILLTACSALVTGGVPVAVDEGGVTDLLDEEIAAGLLDESSSELAAESVDEGASEVAASGAESEPTESGSATKANEVTILTEDDRSAQLRTLTSSWNTDWTRHTVSYDEILSGGPPRDGIRSIDNPKFIAPAEATEWLADNEPVIALELNGDARAYPLSIITWHEIVNDVVGDVPAVVTFCPLCNSALAFDRRFNGEVFEFGVSGLLRNSDLIMYDRTTETLWQQFTGDAIVGELAGERLTFLPTSIVSFGDFRAAHADGQVLSRDTGRNAPYGAQPYAGYDTYESALSSGGNLPLFTGPEDNRLRPADRVVTVSLEEQGIDVAYPYAVLSEVRVVNDVHGEQDLVVFFTPGTASALGAQVVANAEDVGATGVFDPNLNGQKLTFRADGDTIVDEETGSTWNILGQAIEGPLAGEELDEIIHGDHFWFSWAAFKPDTIIFQ